MTDIVIGGGIAGGEVVLVEAAGIGIGTGVDTVAPTILGVEQEGTAELVLQFEQKCIEVSVAIVCVIGDPVNERIKSYSRSGAWVIQVVVFGQMAGVAALIADTGNPAMRQFVFSAECVVVGIGCWLIGREGGQGNGRTAGERQVIGAKGYDVIWICGVSVRVVH